jgi:hypothetical protein
VPPTVADVSGLLRALAGEDVEFMIVGGVCAVIHGAPVSTFDLDIVPERSDQNVSRLMKALAGIGAVHRDLAGRAIGPDASRLSGRGSRRTRGRTRGPPRSSETNRCDSA